MRAALLLKEFSTLKSYFCHFCLAICVQIFHFQYFVVLYAVTFCLSFELLAYLMAFNESATGLSRSKGLTNHNLTSKESLVGLCCKACITDSYDIQDITLKMI